MTEENYIYDVIEVREIHDGDTFKLLVDLGFYCSVTVITRLHKWNAPELISPDGIKARMFVQNEFRQAKKITIQSYKDARSFERWVCDVWLDGVLLGEKLEKAGLAKPIK